MHTQAPNHAWVRGLDMIAADDGWAVGTDGLIMHYDGNAWNQVNSGTSLTFHAVSMVDSQNGWAVGDSGLILRWNGSNWKVQDSKTWSELRAISMTSPTSGWAVGKSGIVLEYRTGGPYPPTVYSVATLRP